MDTVGDLSQNCLSKGGEGFEWSGFERMEGKRLMGKEYF